MCLTIMASEYVPIQFLGEYIDIAFESGELQTREVYDIFFTPRKNYERLRLICLSPHNLIKAGELCAQTVRTPGAGSDDDFRFYIGQLGQKCSYDAEDGGFFSITIPIIDNFVNFKGRVFLAKPVLPNGIGTDTAACDFMETHGTLFEIVANNLTAFTTYVMRVVLHPVKLINVPPKLALHSRLPGRPNTDWIQHAGIIDPRACRFNYDELLGKATSDSKIAECAAHIQTVLATHARFTLPVDHHRIVVLAPPNCPIDLENPIGLCMSQSTKVIGIPTRRAGQAEWPMTMVVEWTSGRAAYPHDDLESLMQLIWHYLDTWAHGNAKSKEEITTAIAGKHENVSLIVDEFVRVGLAQEADTKGKYLAVVQDKDRGNEIVQELACDSALVDRFDWQGFNAITLSHTNISPPMICPCFKQKSKNKRPLVGERI